MNPTNLDDHRNFAHAELRRMRAEVMLDCVSEATDTKNKFPGLPLGARAVQVADGNTSNYFLTTFGRATRATACSCEVRVEPNLSQALHLLNGDTVNSKIIEGGLIKRRLAERKKPKEILDELYIRCLSRRPTDKEEVRADCPFGGESGQETGPARHLLGPVELARVFVQSLMSE